MQLAELVNAIQVVELTETKRAAAIRSMVQAADWEDEGVTIEKILAAIEEREATAHTIVCSDFALPHADIDWDGDFRIFLGRSRAGVDCGAPGGEAIRLMVLLLIGKGRAHRHLDVLAAVAELLGSDDFRREIEEAPDVHVIERLLLQRAGLEPDGARRRMSGIPRLSAVLVRQAMQLVELLPAQALLVAVDRPQSVPWEALIDWTGMLLVVTSEAAADYRIERPNTHVFDVPHATLSRMDRANLGLLLAALTGLLNDRKSVVCVTGLDGRRLDSITVARPDAHLQEMFAGRSSRRAGMIPPAVILRVLSLAIELAAEGREARPVGAMFAIGDTSHVLRYTKQLVLNPFRGYSRHLRNVLDPSLAETVKEYAQIDGAFVIHADGTLHCAGAYLVPKQIPSGLPAGLGTRHQTAAAITAQTRAMVITVSQSTGTVTVFRDGAIIFTLERAAFTRW